jgi:hypothetical protein
LKSLERVNGAVFIRKTHHHDVMSGLCHGDLPRDNGFPRVRLGGIRMKLWIPTLDGFPVGGIKLVETDPLADKNTLANKILSILHASNSFLTSKNIVAALQAEGLAKEPRAISSAVSQALQILKRRKLARSVGHLWMASVNALTKAGTM